MARLRGQLSRQDIEDLAAYLGNPGVPSPNLRLSSSGDAANPYNPERLEFRAPPGAVSPASTLQLRNAGELALRLQSAPALLGAHADQFSISATDCAAGMSLPPQASCSIDIVFHPSGAGALRSALVRIRHDWLRGELSVAMLGESVVPGATGNVRRDDPRSRAAGASRDGKSQR